MAYRTDESDTARARKRRETFTYIPSPRGCLAWLLDAAVVIAIITLALIVARRNTVQCDWPLRGQGRCTVQTENALGMIQERRIEGIHSLAYRTRVDVGFVTDAKNKDPEAQFGTRSIEMWDEASADALEEFASERSAPHLRISRGPDSPVRVGIGFFLLLAGYVVVTRRVAYAFTIDRTARMLTVSKRGWIGRTHRFELANVSTVDVENAEIGRHRVRVVLTSGEHVPITTYFSPGVHHSVLARELAEALAA